MQQLNDYCTQDSIDSLPNEPLQRAPGDDAGDPEDSVVDMMAAVWQGEKQHEEEDSSDDDSDEMSTPTVLDDSNASECKELYIAKGNCKKVLMAMCLGLDANVELGSDQLRPLGNPTLEPYADAPQKASFICVQS